MQCTSNGLVELFWLLLAEDVADKIATLVTRGDSFSGPSDRLGKPMELRSGGDEFSSFACEDAGEFDTTPAQATLPRDASSGQISGRYGPRPR